MFEAKVFRMLISSPADVVEERKLARELAYRWNGIHSADKEVVLLPVSWEYDATPEIDVTPQEKINRVRLDMEKKEEYDEKAKRDAESSRTNHLPVGIPDGDVCRWTAGSGTAVRSWIHGGGLRRHLARV